MPAWRLAGIRPFLNVAADILRESSFDWEAVRDVAIQDRVASLLYYALRHEQILPESLLEEFHNVYVWTATENALWLKELSSILAIFEEKNIPVIVLKGAALLEPLYGNIALLPMSDLDVLIHRSNAPIAVNLLADQGYTPTGSELVQDVTLAFENELLLCKAGRVGWGWPLELHWNLFDSPFYQYRIPESDL
ncbi:MAG: nucleotidyltransferase family protein [Chloroflexota bacterium]